MAQPIYIIFYSILLTMLPHLSSANIPALNKIHKGIHLSAMPLPQKRGDIALLEPTNGILKLIQALDALYAGSRFSAKYLEILKKNGRVSIVYDPNFPKRQLSSVTIAAYFPDFFQKEPTGLKQFLVVIGRFGIKWPIAKLATVIAHELVGHGLQHFRGHRAKDRKIDLECEALIYEIRAQQDLGIRRDANDMIRLRKDIRGKWCADFSRYMINNGIHADKAWGYGRPNVEALLKYFRSYRKYLRRTGESKKAVKAAEAKRSDDFAAFRADAEQSGSAAKLLIVGKRYLNGLGVEKNLHKGALWVAKSARLGHPPAQYLMGVLNATGHGLRKDPIEAYAWLSIAVKNGFNRGGELLGRLEKHLSVKELEEGRRRAAVR